MEQKRKPVQNEDDFIRVEEEVRVLVMNAGFEISKCINQLPNYDSRIQLLRYAGRLFSNYIEKVENWKS